jgi:hypothetical protein
MVVFFIKSPQLQEQDALHFFYDATSLKKKFDDQEGPNEFISSAQCKSQPPTESTPTQPSREPSAPEREPCRLQV